MKGAYFFGWWQVVVALLMQAIGIGGIVTTYSVLAVAFDEAFGPSRMVLMLGMTGMILVAGLVSPWLGAAMDRLSLRLMMLAGAVLLVLAFFILSFATSMTAVLLVYALLISVSYVLLGPLAASTLLSRWFIRKRGMALGIAAMGVSLGSLVFPPLLQFLVDTLEWRAALRAFSGVVLLWTVPALLLFAADRPADKKLFPDGDSEELSTGEAARGAAFTTSGGILRSTDFWLIALSIGLVFFASGGVVPNLMSLAVGMGVSADHAALLISALAIGSFAGKFLFAAVSDRIDLRVAFCAVELALIIGAVCFIYADGYFLLVAGSVFFGFSIGGSLPLWGLLLSRAFGQDNVGRVMGLMTIIIMPLNLAGPPFLGWIFDRTGSYDLAFMVFAGLTAGAIMLLPRIRSQAPAIAPVAS